MLSYCKFHFLKLSELKFNRYEFEWFVILAKEAKKDNPEIKSIKIAGERTKRVINFDEVIKIFHENKIIDNQFKMIMEQMLSTGNFVEIIVKEL